MSVYPEGDSPLLQLQEVDSSRLGGHVLSPAFNSSSPSLPVESHPICIPSPYTDIGHDFTTLPFYSPALLGYGTSPLSDCPSVRQSLSPSLYWPPHSHVSSIALHQQQTRLQQNHPTGGSWAELTPHDHSEEENCKPLAKRVADAEETSTSLRGKADMHYCAVCSDYASGYHYGVWSCEGCKAFFKRSIQGHNDYICPATNQCTIDKNRRKSCQACRLRKCYEVGMMKCGLRRDRGSYQQRGAQQKRLARFSGRMRTCGPRSQEIKSVPCPLGGNKVVSIALSPEELIARIMDAEPPEIFLMKDVKKPFTEANVMMSLTNLADKELVHMISWAKKIPGECITRFIRKNDSVITLAQCVTTCLFPKTQICLTSMTWRPFFHKKKILLNVFVFVRDECSCVQGFVEIFDMLLAATSRFRELKLQREEYACLKAMILLNSSDITLMPSSTVTIDDIVRTNGSNSFTYKRQYEQSLLKMREVCINKGMDHLHCMKMKKMVPLYDLLLEMLDAHIMHGSRLSHSGPRAAPAPKESNA
uniref:Estrogen receptor beta-1-like n=1 Tax=Sinocyclocheilus grahami TaxID=75366 RepID=A0A672KE26_SINGR